MIDKQKRDGGKSASTQTTCSAAGLRVLDLFSGIGGFSLGLQCAGMRTIAFCEIEKFPRKVLRKHWPDIHIFKDVRTLHAADLLEPVELICGGYPCQPFSVAGKRKGKKDDRHLWPEIVRIIQELSATTGKPTWCLFENVAGHISMGIDQVLFDLENEGYTCWPLVIPACAVNAQHRRDRVWIIAHYASWIDGQYNACAVQRQKKESGKGSCLENVSNTCGPGWEKLHIPAKSKNTKHIARGGNEAVLTNSTCKLLDRTRGTRTARRNEHTNSSGLVANAKSEQAGRIFKSWFSPNPESGGDWRGQTEEWTTEPPVCGADDGIPNRVARLKALGNAVVPQIPEMIGHAIMTVEATRQ